LWLARPLPVVLWGLPRPLRERGGELLAGRSPLRRLLKRAAGPGQTWLVYIMVYWGWHDPHLYNLALGHEWVHDLEHISFFGVAVLYFWHIVGAGPLIHRRLPYLLRMAYALAAVPVNMIAGVAIAFAEQPLYAFYAAMPRLWGLSLMDDQRIAGVIMWIPGSMMFVLAALVLAGRWLQQEERKPALTERDWAADEAVLAPGWRRK
ncbi:MAG: cytochrome c oxidase assembly protein, partial [Candidatus Promineifilaceae bacterium]